MESCIRPGGEEGVTEDEQTPQKYGNFSKAVFIISAAPNSEGTGGYEEASASEVQERSALKDLLYQKK